MRNSTYSMDLTYTSGSWCTREGLGYLGFRVKGLCIGIMEKKMETTIVHCLGLSVATKGVLGRTGGL